jgi:hypothetical protein
LVAFNSPFTGVVEGTVAAMSIKMATTPLVTSTEDRLRYTVYQWYYGGQVSPTAEQRVPDSACGSAIWDHNGRVMGFFRYYIEEGNWAGFCASVAADEVVRAGYRFA